jgi:O-antigen ligase
VLLGAGIAAGTGRARRVAGSALGAASATALVGSGSRTAMVATTLGVLVAVVALVGFPARRWARIGLQAVLGGGAVVGVWVAWAVSTLARRRELWELAWNRALERPILGHGWFTVWRDAGWVDTDPLLRLGNAHDSALDVLLGIGVVGLVPFAAIVGFAGRNAWRAARRRPGAVTATRLAIVTLLVVEHLTESFVLLYSYNWVLLMAAALAVGGAGRSGPDRRTPVPTATATG